MGKIIRHLRCHYYNMLKGIIQIIGLFIAKPLDILKTILYFFFIIALCLVMGLMSAFTEILAGYEIKGEKVISKILNVKWLNEDDYFVESTENGLNKLFKKLDKCFNF